MRGKKEIVANCRLCHRYFTRGGPTDFRYMNRIEQGKKAYTGYMGLNAKIRRHWRKYHRLDDRENWRGLRVDLT